MAQVYQSPYGTTTAVKGQDTRNFNGSTAQIGPGTGVYVGGMGMGWNPKQTITNSLPNKASSLINAGVGKAYNSAVKASNNTTTNTSKPSGSTGGGGGVGAGINALQSAYLAQQNNMMSALMSALQAQQDARNQAIAAANAALDKQAGYMTDRYNTSKQELQNDYQSLRNQASVNNFKARRAMRESQADRGAFDSGAGMQENIRLGANFGNIMNKIGLQENTARQNLLNNLNQLLAQIDMQKANNMVSGINGYGNNLASLINAAYSGYTPDAGYLGLAQQFANGQGYTPVQSNNAIGTSLYDTLLRQYGI